MQILHIFKDERLAVDDGTKQTINMQKLGRTYFISSDYFFLSSTSSSVFLLLFLEIEIHHETIER